jgi:predicted CopG family antitoxin
MPNITISVSEELYNAIKKYKQIRWSEVARRAMQEYAKRLAILDNLLKGSELTEKDAVEIGQRIKHRMAKRYDV